LEGLFVIILYFYLLVLRPSYADAVLFTTFFCNFYLFDELLFKNFVGIQLRLDVGVHHRYREVLASGVEEAIGIELCEIFQGFLQKALLILEVSRDVLVGLAVLLEVLIIKAKVNKGSHY
jgi:hypothetical protein